MSVNLSNEYLIERYKSTKDVEYLSMLWCNNIGLAKSVAKQYLIDYMELAEPFMSAITKYELGKAKFTTYLTKCYHMYIYKQLANNTRNFILTENISTDCITNKIDNKIDISETIKKLPINYQAVIYLRYYKDLNYTAIAKRLGISQPQASRLSKKATDMLKTLLGGDTYIN